MVLLDIDGAFKAGVIHAQSYVKSLQDELIKNRKLELSDDLSEFDDMTEELSKYDTDPEEILNANTVANAK